MKNQSILIFVLILTSVLFADTFEGKGKDDSESQWTQ